MIVLEFSFAVALYIFLTTIALLLYWLFFEKAKYFKDYSLSDRHVWQCSICTYFYIDSKHTTISVCPRCGSYNEKVTTSFQKEVKG
ncbi:MAG: hypothetical protein AMJ78_10035 [Omnitrophica WOR_2 bacterium SM23_29]|nr:MAG: hypothetical protein AMJ78_10035 [Omnitrophica WOR_2 bacterium SM23_29]